LLRAIRKGELDRIVAHEAPLDVLAQQIVAESACDDYSEDEMYALMHRAWPYRDLARKDCDEVRAARRAGASRRSERAGARLARFAYARHRIRRRHPRGRGLSGHPRRR